MLPIASPSLRVRGALSPALLRRLAVAAVGLAFVSGLVALVRNLDGGPPERARQVARIAVLPDTPPPPPPPERKPDPPKAENKTAPQPVPVAAPQAPKADAPIKMEGPAGDGPSAFQQGTVTDEYRGGPPQVGGGASAPALVDRAQERLYANTVRQMLRDEIERQLAPEAGELTSSFAIWVGADGRIDRFELEPGAAPQQEASMRGALEASARSLQLPPPPSAALPLRFRLTVRAAG